MLNRGLGYDFNTVEFAVRDGIPYAIDFCNPAPDADVNSVGDRQLRTGSSTRWRTWRSAGREAFVRGTQQPAVGRVCPRFPRPARQVQQTPIRGRPPGPPGRQTAYERARSCSRLGIEEEFQLIDPEDVVISARTSTELLGRATSDVLNDQLKAEMHQSVIEAGTQHLRGHQGGAPEVCTAARPARRERAVRTASPLAAAGTHPVRATGRSRTITPSRATRRSSRTCSRSPAPT